MNNSVSNYSIDWCGSALALSRAIHARELSCRELMQATLARIATLNPRYNALVALQAPELLLQQADACDRELAQGQSRGWLHGLPQAPKATADAAGWPTTRGSLLCTHEPSTHDSLMLARARAAGAIFIGRTNVPEFGLGSHTYNRLYGATGNAWNPGRSAGGSSGGAAVAVALGMLPVADGSDVMGSLRNPAAWNNVYGLRPSLGRVPQVPAPEVFFQHLLTEGPIARNVPDLAKLLSTQAGADSRSPLALTQDAAQFAQPLQASMKGKRIAWGADLGGYLPFEPGVLPLCEGALRYFGDLGCEVETFAPSFDYAKLWSAWLALRSVFVHSALSPLYADPEKRAQMKPEACWEVEQGGTLSATDWLSASKVRSDWYQALMRVFEHFDYWVLPCAQVFPFDVAQHWPAEVGGRTMQTYHQWMEVTIYGTMTGLPTISLPAGFSADGLPMGLQVLGRPRDDWSLLQLAHAWEQATPFAAQRPAVLSRL